MRYVSTRGQAPVLNFEGAMLSGLARDGGLYLPETIPAFGGLNDLDGLPYEARWASRGEAPGTLFPIGSDEPWAPLFTIPGEPAGS